MKCKPLALLAAALLLAGCAGPGERPPSDGPAAGVYRQIPQDEAARILREETGVLLLDVRTQEEFDEGHIPGAICIPNETIDGPHERLPDREQTILVYCRSGRRSKEAAQKLADAGYVSVLEFGGILTWEGELVTGGDG